MSEQRFGLIAGRYLLRDQLGHGGMGRVWLAHDETLDRDVAIKEVTPPPHLSPDQANFQRELILREAKAAGRINDPRVVKIYDVLQTEKWPWIVMEYVPSVNLERMVHEGGPLPPAQVADIGLAVLEALVAAHDAGVLHRDVKPGNVLLGDDGRVVLSDFGLATFDTDGKVTRAVQLGTPQYLAPERARYGTSSREADFWSLGATLYAAVEGRSPYHRDSMLETLSALAVDEPDPMRLAGPLEPILAGLLKRNPADRTAPDLLAKQLRRVVAGEPVESPPTPAAPQPSRKPDRKTKPMGLKRAVLIGVGSLTVLVTAGAVLTNGNRGDGGGGTPVVDFPISGGPRVPAMGIPFCETLPAQTLPLPKTRPTGEFALPEGWMRFSDPAGFSTAVPEHWDYWRSFNTVCFRDPRGNRIMGVIPFRPKAEMLPGYAEVAQKEVLLKGPATEWEFTYTLHDRKRHAIAVVTSGSTIFWIADDLDFMASRALYDLIRIWFDAGGPRPMASSGARPGG